MSNPFKFGSVVDKSFFTDRKNETKDVIDVLNSENHLVLIGPRRYGKTSLIQKVTAEMKRPVVYLDVQLVTDISDMATQLLKRILKISKWENIKRSVANFRIVPTIGLNPLTDAVEIAFQPAVSKNFTPLEDVLNLIEKIGKKNNRPIVIFDEFQEVASLGSSLPKQLRSVLQHHKNVNYVFLGSVESMMTQIFETKKSPFYHFGYFMHLDKIPYSDFFDYLKSGLDKVTENSELPAAKILEFTNRHPYYTQQLAFYIYTALEDKKYSPNMFDDVVTSIVEVHNNDFERLWNTISKTDKRILIALAVNGNISDISQPTSTVYSGLKRLARQSYLIKNDTYEFDDPFFEKWIADKRSL